MMEGESSTGIKKNWQRLDESEKDKSVVSQGVQKWF